MFNMIGKIKEIKAEKAQQKVRELECEMDYTIGLIRGLTEHYNRAICHGDVTSICFYEQELVEKEKRLNKIKARLA